MPAKIYPPPYAEVPEIHADVLFPDSHPEDPGLPYVAMNMVSSLDGRVSVDGKSGVIGSSTDREVMRTLRSKADAVMIGAGTLRSENASLTSEGRRNPEPAAVIVSGSLDIPFDNLKDNDPESTIILTNSHGPRAQKVEKNEPDGVKGVKILTSGSGDGEIDFDEALRSLKEEYGIYRILLEGGPTLNASLLSGSLISEVFLTLSPKILSGEESSSSGIFSGATIKTSPKLILESIHQAEADEYSRELFLRYKLS